MTASSKKALLEWDEPGKPQRYWLRQLRRRDWIKLATPDFAKWFLILAALMLVGTLVFHKLNLIEILAISFTGALVMIVPDIYTMFRNPVHISLRENDIERFGIDGAVHIGYKDIQRCTLRAQDFDGTTACGLEILMHDGNTVIFEIAPSISYHDIRTVLHDKGIEVN